jgi:hypothetical protein
LEPVLAQALVMVLGVTWEQELATSWGEGLGLKWARK